MAPSYIEDSARKAGKAAKEGEDRNLRHYDHLMNDFEFVSVSVETFGTWGERGLKFIKEIGKLITDKNHDKRATSYLFQALSIAIQRGNSLSVTGTLTESNECLEEIFYL